MRSEAEVQRAHDLLHGIVIGDAPYPVKEDERKTVHAVLDALCWVLQHHDGQPEGFHVTLRSVEDWLRKRGYVLRDSGVTAPWAGPS